MARRRRQEVNLFDEILDLFLDIGKTLPWWVTLPVAALLFSFVPLEIPSEIQASEPTAYLGVFFGIFFKFLFKYLVPLALFLGTVISLVSKFKKTLQTSRGPCPRCGSDLVEREGLKGSFVGCSSFPKCRYTEDL